jgi:hypothetical protein
VSATETVRLSELIQALELKTIAPMEISSRRLADSPPQGSEIQLEWNQALADGDPVATSADARVFRPKYELTVRHGGSPFFRQTSVFIVAFRLKNSTLFDQLWTDEGLRAVFVERQIRRTMWPIFRQHVLDGMSRLAMPPVTLPWIA